LSNFHSRRELRRFVSQYSWVQPLARHAEPAFAESGDYLVSVPNSSMAFICYPLAKATFEVVILMIFQFQVELPSLHNY
jgi:hypothetical protein